MVQNPRPVYILSDGTGVTAEKVVRAGLKQFTGYLVHLQVFSEVQSREELLELVKRAARADALIVTTFVQEDMRRQCEAIAAEQGVETMDLLAPLLHRLEGFLRARPAEVPGRLHQADEDYFRRVEAVEFTVKADDGKEPRLLRKADIVLVGVSRTSKTPLSVFLAHKGFKVSNVPVVLDRPLPPVIHELDQKRIFGLTVDPETLADIRRERLATMRVMGRSNYGDMDYILAELEWSEVLFRQNPGWPVIDVTKRAVEETASIIVRIMSERGMGRDVGEVGQL
ncbi:MAG: pyruvate, water dikinase regulatory protein [Myxococcota bacterium]|nr:pyruvate, water dikinase regulatory protein [Myxococcota bacterium]